MTTLSPRRGSSALSTIVPRLEMLTTGTGYSPPRKTRIALSTRPSWRGSDRCSTNSDRSCLAIFRKPPRWRRLAERPYRNATVLRGGNGDTYFSRKSTCPHSVLLGRGGHRRRAGAAVLLPEIGLAHSVAGHRLVERGGVVEEAVQHSPAA